MHPPWSWIQTNDLPSVARLAALVAVEEWNYLLGKEINTNRRKEKLEESKGGLIRLCVS